jgi:hypothetical protein
VRLPSIAMKFLCPSEPSGSPGTRFPVCAVCSFVLGFTACTSAQTPRSAATPQLHRTQVSRMARGRSRQRTEHREKASAATQPPTVTLEDGSLTVDARNSDLGVILDDVAKLSGMEVDGVGTGAHVFGVYGPGNPRQVLTELLDGLGYNFMMVGDTTGGTPRELLLTARSAAPPSPPAQASSAAGKSEASDDAGDQEPPGPGAIVHVPPSVAQQADDSQTQQRVQQNLERLEKMHQQMQQQNQPQ